MGASAVAAHAASRSVRSWLVSVHLSCRPCQNFKLSQQSQSVTFHAAFVYSHLEFRRSPGSITFQLLQRLGKRFGHFHHRIATGGKKMMAHNGGRLCAPRRTVSL